MTFDPRRSSRSGSNPSLVDVANQAGVSRGTVSNVLNYPEKVVPATLEKVRRAIADLGYVRNDAARSLAAGQSASLGFVLANIENSLFVDMIYGAQQAARTAKKSILLGNSSDDLAQQNSYLDLFDEARVGGVLLAPMEDSSEGIRRMRAHGRQIVLLNFDPVDHDCCAVLSDNELVGYLAARHLIETGRNRIAYVAGRDEWQPVHARRLGVRRAIAESAGVSLIEVETEQIGFSDGAQYGNAFLDLPVTQRPDGVVAVSDAIANGFLDEVMRKLGVVVPDEVAVVGCENNRSAPGQSIPLTVVEPAGREMGFAAVTLLLDEMAAEPAAHVHRVLTFEPRLIIKDSTVRAH